MYDASPSTTFDAVLFSLGAAYYIHLCICFKQTQKIKTKVRWTENSTKFTKEREDAVLLFKLGDLSYGFRASVIWLMMQPFKILA